MCSLALRIHGLSKAYSIEQNRQDRPTNFMEMIARRMKHPFQSVKYEIILGGERHLLGD